MGRGKNKAKQTKIAREMKYNSVEIDYDSLAKDLHGERRVQGRDHNGGRNKRVAKEEKGE